MIRRAILALHAPAGWHLNSSATPSNQSSLRTPSLLWLYEATWPSSSPYSGARSAVPCDCQDARWLFPNPSHAAGGLHRVFWEAWSTQYVSNTETVGVPASHPGLARTDHDIEWRNSRSFDRRWRLVLWLSCAHVQAEGASALASRAMAPPRHSANAT